MRTFFRHVLFATLAGCASTNTYPNVHVDQAPLAVPHAHANADCDPRWNDASDTLERLSERCELRRAALEEEVHDARTTSGVVTALAVVAAVAGEVAADGTSGGVALGDARCQAPSGPTATLPGAAQASAMPCGGMAAAGGAGPFAQRAQSAQVTAADRVEAMHQALDAASEWLEVHRSIAEWTEEDDAAWFEHVDTLRALCSP